MLTGSVNSCVSKNSSDQTKGFGVQLLQWDGVRTIACCHGAFAGKILSNADHSTLDDYFFVDKQDEMLVFMEGEIFNQGDLVQSLSLTNSDLPIPQIVAKAFLQWGPCFAERLNGDFSIIIYLPQKETAYFYRDHLGIRPLAVSIRDGQVHFATDPMGLARALFSDQKIDSRYLLNYFSYEDTDATLMPHKDIIKIKAGHYLLVTPNNVAQHKYWFPEKIHTDHRLTQAKVISDLTALVQDAVQIRADSNYVAGAHLSGGLDSGVVAALVRKAYPHQAKFYGFSWTPEDETKTAEVAHDERILVGKTATLNKIEPVFSAIEIQDYLDFASDWRHPSEMIYEHKTVQAAKARGVNLLFSGWGGDEFISIDQRGIDPDLIRQFKWRHFLKKYPINKPKRLIYALVFNALFPSLKWKYSKYKVDKSLYPYVKQAAGSMYIPRKERFKFTSRRKVHLQLLELGHLGARTSDWYVHGQRNGIEYRYPLLDKRIVEYMLKVPSQCLMGDNHYRILLRVIGKDLLPAEVLKNNSKDDPLKSKQFYKFVGEVKSQFIQEFEDFRRNPDLAFVDFDLLKKNIPTILDNIAKGKKEDGSSIFYSLKAAHEFTKSYYN